MNHDFPFNHVHDNRLHRNERSWEKPSFTFDGSIQVFLRIERTEKLGTECSENTRSVYISGCHLK